MYLGEPSNKRRRMIIGGIIATLVLLFVIAFWQELVDVVRTVVLLARDGTLPENLDSFGILLYNLFTFLVLSVSWIYLISQQALLPASTLQERWRTAYQFVLYILGQHGPAVFVKDGEVLSTKEDVRDGPGVAVVDFNSAVVLEERLPPPGLTSGFDSSLHRLAWSLGLADRAESPRVMGPGIVFTRQRERIRTAVDLRRQFRQVRDVTGYTRDGIEVISNVWSIFTIGQDPEPDSVEVTYEGEIRPENLRSVRYEKIDDNHLRVTGFHDDVDERDKQEIHHHYQVLARTLDFIPFEPLPPPRALPEFNNERVFAAVYSEAHGENEKKVPWTDLPARLAVAIFRELISQVNYDQLYQVGSPLPFPMFQFKSRLRHAMRNNGLLSYRVIFLKKGEPLQLRRVYAYDEVNVSAIKPLVNSKILRDRGIKVIASGYGDILPVNEAIYHARVESWSAPWKRDQEIVSGASEFETLRVHARARALAQQDLAVSLNSIIESTMNPEVIAIRLLQTFESIASDPRTSKLLPPNTLDVMRQTHLLLTQTGYGNPPPPPPGTH
jgi:hypothetical protein